MAGEVDTPGRPEAKKQSKIVLSGIAATTFAVAGLAAFFIAPKSTSAQPKAVVKEKTSAAGAEKHGGAAENAHEPKGADRAAPTASSFEVVNNIGLYKPAVFVVSMRPTGRVRYLKLSIVVETDPNSAAIYFENESRIRDTLTTYLRTIDIGVVEDPSAMALIKQKIAWRISAIVDPVPVFSILITDFILS